MADPLDDALYEVGVAATATVITGGSIDEHLDRCPRCNRDELRAEVVVDWRTPAECANALGIPEAVIQADKRATRDMLGRIKVGVPYVTCMACGLRADASESPEQATS